MKLAHILTFSTLTLFATPALYAQDNWKQNPKIHNVAQAYKDESLVLILDARDISYEVNEQTKQYYIVRKSHRIFKLMDEKGVESENKQIIPTDYNSKIVKMKFRLIKTNGKVKEVAENDIKSSTGENGNLQYHVAYEDANIGDEIEYYIEENEEFQPFGGENLQLGIPTIKSTVSISSPLSLSIQGKSYNGYPEFKIDTVDNIVYHKAEQSNIPALEDEKYADTRLHMQKINYKVVASEGTGRKPLFTWNDFAKQRYNYLYEINEKEKKALQKFLSNINISESQTDEQKIKTLEDVLKAEIIVNNELEDAKYADIDFLLDKKTTYKQAYLRLWVNTLDLLGIKHEVGLGTNKFVNDLDEKFAYWNHLETYLIYINSLKQYVLPLESTLRFPALTPITEGSKGVFIKRLSANNVTTASANFRTLPVTPFDQHKHNLDILVNLNDDGIPQINVKNIFTGMSANGFREIATFIKKEDDKKFIATLIDYINDENDIKNYQYINKGIEHYSDNKPLIIEADVVAPKLVEKAGNKYLFKIGAIIGRQEELYQENKRQLPISIPFGHMLKRDIKLNIPKGYKIANPEVLNKSIGTKGKFGFESSYKIDNDQISITIYEYYQETSLPAQEYDNFRKVINAAADFNKVTLILDKI